MAGGCLCFPPGLNHSVWEFYLQDDFDRDFLSKGVKDGFRIIDEGAKHDLSHVKLTIISLAFNMQNKSREIMCEVSNNNYVVTCVTVVTVTVVSASGTIPKSNA